MEPFLSGVEGLRVTICLQSFNRFFHPAIVKPHSVNNCGIFLQAKQSRLFIAQLGFWGYGSYFNKTEAEI